MKSAQILLAIVLLLSLFVSSNAFGVGLFGNNKRPTVNLVDISTVEGSTSQGNMDGMSENLTYDPFTEITETSSNAGDFDYLPSGSSQYSI